MQQTLKAVLLNDTSTANHHGCRHVIGNMEYLLSKNDIEIMARSPVGYHWQNDPEFLKSLPQCDLIIINGEGTLHDGRDEAKRLLDIADYEPTRDIPKFLVNALYLDNPDSWYDLLNKFNLISFRDSLSYQQAIPHISASAMETLDLSLYCIQPPLISEEARKGMAYGDSVLKPISKKLRQIAKAQDQYYMPVRTNRKNWKYNLKTALLTLVSKKNIIVENETVFMQHLKQREHYITGRFHGVCLALKTFTPFTAIGSNTSKIQTLLKTFNMSDRFCDIKDLDQHKLHPLSEDEVLFIKSKLAENNTKWESVFQEIRKIALTVKES